MDLESKSRVVYENLDTAFVNLWALLRNLSQRGFIGRVRVELEDYTADVFMTGSSTPLVHEIDRAAGTDTLEEAALHRLVLRVRETPGNASDAHTETENDHARVGRARPKSPTEPLWSSESQTLADKNDHEHQTATPAVAAEPVDEIEWSATVKAGGELIGGVERAVTGAGADFASLFNTARLELADDYTFLDPMAGEFTYANSLVTLSEEKPAGSYVSGLSEALRRVVERVATGDQARRVRERVALELSSVARRRREILARSGFLPQLDRIAGTKVI